MVPNAPNCVATTMSRSAYSVLRKLVLVPPTTACQCWVRNGKLCTILHKTHVLAGERARTLASARAHNGRRTLGTFKYLSQGFHGLDQQPQDCKENAGCVGQCYNKAPSFDETCHLSSTPDAQLFNCKPKDIGVSSAIVAGLDIDWQHQTYSPFFVLANLPTPQVKTLYR